MKPLLFSKKNAPPELVEKAQQLVAKVMETGMLNVRTSGSTGQPKEISIGLAEIKASAERTKKALNITDGAVLCSLPLDYIAGIMQVFRAYFWQQPLAMVQPSLDPLQSWNEEKTALATFTAIQWRESKRVRGNALNLIERVILGGSAIPANTGVPEGFEGAVYASYGMTETVSHIALRQLYPVKETAYVPLPDVAVRLEEPLQTLSIKVGDQPWIQTTDTATLNRNGFTIVGRVDNVIISGGLKVQPEPMEHLYSSVLSCQAVIIGMPDEVYGQKVVLVIDRPKSSEEVKAVSAQLKRPQEAPKAYLLLENFPKTSSGKLDRNKILTVVSQPDLIEL